MTIVEAPAARVPTRAVAALRAALGQWPGAAGSLASVAADHLEATARERPAEDLAAIAVPVAVHSCLSPDPIPDGLLACAAGTYLALDLLDDLMDGDRPAFWRDRPPAERLLGAHLLLLTADRAVGAATLPDRLAELYRDMLGQVFDGQLRSGEPLAVDTPPTEVAAAIADRSGAMLAGLAAMAAVAAGADSSQVDAARRFGAELGAARQHLNDVTELVGDRSSDLVNGTATMATAFALQAVTPERAEVLLGQLRAAATDPELRHTVVREQLAPAIAEVCILIRWHLAAAHSAASFLAGPGVRHDGLRRLIAHTAEPLQETRWPPTPPVKLSTTRSASDSSPTPTSEPR